MATADNTAQSPLFGWFTNYAGQRNLQTYENSGVKLIQFPVWPPHWRQTELYLQKAQQHHLQVMLSIPNQYIRRLDIVRNVVRRYRGNPTVWGWFLYDEPDYWHLPPAVLQHAYRAVKALDSRPVMVAFMSGHCHFNGHHGSLDPAYLQTFDILSIDHFVLFKSGRKSGKLSDEQAYYDRCVQVAHDNHKLWTMIILQAFGGLRSGKAVWRDPTLGEEEYMTQMAERSGAMGIMYWASYRADRAVSRNVAQVIRAQIAAFKPNPSATATFAMTGTAVPGAAATGVAIHTSTVTATQTAAPSHAPGSGAASTITSTPTPVPRTRSTQIPPPTPTSTPLSAGKG